MKKLLLPMVLLLVPLALAGCGEEGDGGEGCELEIESARGVSLCMPTEEGMGLCVIEPVGDCLGICEHRTTIAFYKQGQVEPWECGCTKDEALLASCNKPMPESRFP